MKDNGFIPPTGSKIVGVNHDAINKALGKLDRSSTSNDRPKKPKAEVLFLSPNIVVGHDRIEITLGKRLESRANVNKHWRHTHQQKKDVNEAVQLMLALVPNSLKEELTIGAFVEMIRVAPRFLDKDDNLPMAFKGIKDTIAQWLFGGQVGRNDERKEVEWAYGQVRDRPKTYGVIISIQMKKVVT